MFNRLKLNFERSRVSGSPAVPFDYKYILYSNLLNKILSVDSKLSESIHEGSFKRAFVLSNLFFSRSKGSINAFNSRKFHFYLTSRDSSVLKAILDGFLTDPVLKFPKSSYVLKNVEREVYEDVDSFSILSPLVFRSKDGNYIYPKDLNLIDKFIGDSLVRVASALNISLGDPKVSIEHNCDNLESCFKKRIYHIHNTPIVGWIPADKSVRIKVSDPIAKRVAFYMGLGDRTHLGFGMVGV